MLVSIIIPIYNVEEYIERCLLSVLNQTYSNLEIILVNDCTPDNTMSKVNDVLHDNTHDTQIYIINHEENQGLSAARNTGLNLAKGEYVFFLDSDDAITLDCIEVLVNASQGEDIIIGGFLKNNGAIFYENIKAKYVGSEIFQAYFSGKIYDMACNKLVNRLFLIDNELFFKPKLIHEDFLWTYQTSMVASSVVVITHSTYLYYIREGSLNTSFTMHNIENIFMGFNLIQKDIIEKEYYKNAIVEKYLIDKTLFIRIMAVTIAKIDLRSFKDFFKDFKGLNLKRQGFKTIMKYYLLKSPSFFQYIFFKLRHRIL